MYLTSNERSNLQEILLRAYPKRSALEQLVNLGLNESLDAITEGDNLTQTIFKLIQWAESQGRIEELINKSFERNSGNPELQTFIRDVLPTLKNRSLQSLSIPPKYSKLSQPTPRWSVVDVSHIQALITNLDSPEPVLLLGAGASQKSGIPLSRGLIEQAAREAYCRLHNLSHDNPTIRRSDWFRMLEKHLQSTKIVELGRSLRNLQKTVFFAMLNKIRIQQSFNCEEDHEEYTLNSQSWQEFDRVCSANR